MRSRCYQVVTDTAGDILPNSSVRVLQPGSDPAAGLLVTDPIYKTKDGTDVLGSTFVTANGVVEFWMDNPQFVQLAVTPPGILEYYVDNTPVFNPTPPTTGGGGGGGSFGGSTFAQPANCDQAVQPGSGMGSAPGMRAIFYNWAFSQMATGQPGPTLVDKAAVGYGFNPRDAGWYQIRAILWAGFVAGTTPLPEWLKLEFSTYYDRQGVSHEFTCHDVMGNFGSDQRSIHGVIGTLVSHIFYVPPDSQLVAEEDNPIQFRMFWPGDAALVSATGGNANYALRLDVAKLG